MKREMYSRNVMTCTPIILQLPNNAQIIIEMTLPKNRPTDTKMKTTPERIEI